MRPDDNCLRVWIVIEIFCILVHYFQQRFNLIGATPFNKWMINGQLCNNVANIMFTCDTDWDHVYLGYRLGQMSCLPVIKTGTNVMFTCDKDKCHGYL